MDQNPRAGQADKGVIGRRGFLQLGGGFVLVAAAGTSLMSSAAGAAGAASATGRRPGTAPAAAGGTIRIGIPSYPGELGPGLRRLRPRRPVAVQEHLPVHGRLRRHRDRRRPRARHHQHRAVDRRVVDARRRRQGVDAGAQGRPRLPERQPADRRRREVVEGPRLRRPGERRRHLPLDRPHRRRSRSRSSTRRR